MDESNFVQSCNKKYNPVAEAYSVLLKVFEDESAGQDDAFIAIEEALGFLGEALA